METINVFINSIANYIAAAVAFIIGFLQGFVESGGLYCILKILAYYTIASMTVGLIIGTILYFKKNKIVKRLSPLSAPDIYDIINHIIYSDVFDEEGTESADYDTQYPTLDKLIKPRYKIERDLNRKVNLLRYLINDLNAVSKNIIYDNSLKCYPIVNKKEVEFCLGNFYNLIIPQIPTMIFAQTEINISNDDNDLYFMMFQENEVAWQTQESVHYLPNKTHWLTIEVLSDEIVIERF